MGFRTKLDFSDNRQVKQRIETTTVLSGATAFGVPYDQLPTGPNYSLSSITQTVTTTSASTGTFSGNNTTTVYTWPDSRLYLADNTISALTPSNSAITQTTDYVFSADSSSMFIVDGNVGYGLYTGVSYTVVVLSIYDLGSSNYSGTVQYNNLQLVEAPGLDFSGRTIWTDVSGITRTDGLIITDNPNVGYVWTCNNIEGMGEWAPVSGSPSASIWTAGTGIHSAVLGGSGSVGFGDYSVAEGYTTLASGDISHAEGYNTTATGNYSHAEGYRTSATTVHSHAEGRYTLASGQSSHAEGESTRASGDFSHAEGSGTRATGSTAHAEGSETFAFGSASHAEGNTTLAGGDVSHAEGYSTIASGYAAHAEGSGTVASGDYSHAEGYSDSSGITTASGYVSHAEGWATLASGDKSHAQGYMTIASGETSHAGGYHSNVYSLNGFIHSFYSTIELNSDFSAILGGGNNNISAATYSTIIGGELNNLNTANYSIIAGGSGNTITKNTDNLTQPKYSGIFAGLNNKIIPRFGSGSDGVSGSYCAIVGGGDNTISGHSYSFIGGGSQNLIACEAGYNAIIGGEGNVNHAAHGVIIGGYYNTLSAMTSCPSYSDNSVIIGGNFNFLNQAENSVILGGQAITATTSNTVYVPNLIVNTGGTQSKLGINTNSPEYTIDARGNGNRLYYSNASLGNLTLSATTGLPMVGIVAGTANTANQTASVSMGVRAWNDSTYTVYGYQGDAFIYAGIYTNGLNIISNDGSTLGTGADYIRFYAGQASGAGAGNNPDLHIQGSGSSRGYVAINVPYNQDPTQRLDVNGNARFRGVGSTASAGALHYTSDGTLTTNTSDERLKTNIETLTGALGKVKQLRGVKYNWTEEPNGDVRIGLIAQEVNSVVPELTFVNKNTEEQYMGVHYDNVVALLIEAVKELSSGVTISNNTHLETQTILAEDNNVELNFNGNQQTAIGGGLSILHAKGQDQSADLITDANGNFITNNDFKPQALTIPLYTPTSSNDTAGSEGNITRDDNYMYVKTSTGWKRTNLESF